MVEFQKNELCRSVCLQKNGLKLFEIFIRDLLRGLAIKQTRPSRILLVMTQDKPNARYLLQAVLQRGTLDLQIFPHPKTEYQRESFLPYNIGDKLDITRWYPNREHKIKAVLQNIFEASYGEKYRIYVDAETLPRRDLNMVGMPFRFYPTDGYHVAAVFLFASRYT